MTERSEIHNNYTQEHTPAADTHTQLDTPLMSQHEEEEEVCERAEPEAVLSGVRMKRSRVISYQVRSLTQRRAASQRSGCLPVLRSDRAQ